MDDAMQRYEEICDQMVVRSRGQPRQSFRDALPEGLGKNVCRLLRREHDLQADRGASPLALGLPGARLFDPGMGRPMKEWVQVPFAQQAPGSSWR